MDVSTSDLRQIALLLLDHLEHTDRMSVNLQNDYYWSIPSDTRYDPTRQPNELTLGQLSDDWSELQKMKSGESDVIAYGLVWLASVLRAIGEQSPA